MKKNLFTIALKWGALLGVTLAGCELVKMLARDINYDAGAIFSILLLIVLILFLYGASKEFRDDLQEGYIRFPKAFGVGAVTTVVAVILVFAYMLLHYSAIDKDGLQRLNETNVEHFYQRAAKENVSGEVVAAYLCQTDSIVRNTYLALVRDNAVEAPCADFTQTQMEVILKAYNERVQMSSNVDTVHFTYKNFPEFAQLTFLDVYQNLLSNTNANDSCYKALSVLVNNAHTNMAKVNILDQAYQLNKSKVPHYTSILPVSLSYAFSVLLYGLFVNIFVALYVAKRREIDNDTLPKD